MSTSPFLSDAEIAEICAPLEQPAAQVRYLCRQGLIVKRKPNGKPLVARGEFERVLVGRQPEQGQNAGSGQPDRAALLKLIRGGKRGAQAQGR
ncbi:hypothetical protein C7T35_01150 [Variovorax sp. WS11]|uniref:DUF4224 domain-containing protein n=1 Tax=Variovorax sp. WS11 TaxID=1105204 RepID=UPI000D0CD434|nr:DUF4224 domain-containing protein [Variovorax sp. WS11]NDZ11545.1 DUF4224 domain-containing protein [Variovorax sp. WS11]PSL86603.1 hypothetical protein C7T35_01150 [Variovorax sp. WS11]